MKTDQDVSVGENKAIGEATRYVGEGFPGKWWFEGELPKPQLGWPEVFAAANYHCIYCSKNLSATLEDLVASTTDHIVPQFLFAKNTGSESANHFNNLAPACSVCNSIKASWHPSANSAAWHSRREFVRAARKHIAREKHKRRRQYAKHLGKAKVTVWPPGSDFS